MKKSLLSGSGGVPILSIALIATILSTIPVSAHQRIWVDEIETVRPPHYYSPGGYLDVVGMLKNNRGDSDPFTLVVCLFNSRTYRLPPSPGVFIVGDFQMPGLPASSTVPFDKSVFIPPDIPPGDYWIGAFVPEHVENSMRGMKIEENSIAIEQPLSLPDLLPYSVSAVGPEGASDLYAGDIISVSVTVSNKGEAVASSYAIGLYLSTGRGATEPSLSPLVIQNVPTPLAVGASAVHELSGAIPADTSPGRYYAGMLVTADGDADPSNDWKVDPDRLRVLQPLARLSGDILDDDNNQPVAEAAVEWGRARDESDANGVFDFVDVTPGTHALRVTAAGFFVYDAVVPVAAGEHHTESLRLMPYPAPVVSNVTAAFDALSGNVEIFYDLESVAGFASINVQVSSDHGTTFSNSFSSFRGEGYGDEVIPGQRKRIVWDARGEWPEQVVDQGMRMRVVATVHGRSDQGDSNDFGMDTRLDDKPVVKDVWGVFFDRNRPCYFLEAVDVWLLGLGRLPLVLPLSVDVEWNGFEPGTIEWRVAGLTAAFSAQTDGQAGVFVLPISHLPAGAEAVVELIAADGTRSIPYRANFEVVKKPVYLAALAPFLSVSAEYELPGNFSLMANFLAVQTGWFTAGAMLPILFDGSVPLPPSGTLHYGAEFKLDIPEVLKLASGSEEPPDSFTVPGKVPIIGGHSLPIPTIEASVSATGAGTAEGRLGVDVGIEKLKTRMGPVEVGVGPRLAYFDLYDPAMCNWNGQWDVGIRLSGSVDGPKAQLWVMPPVYFSSKLGGHGEVSCRFGEQTAFGGGIGLDVEGAVGVGLAGIAGIEGYLGGGPEINFSSVEDPWLELLIRAGARVIFLFWTETLAELQWHYDSRYGWLSENASLGTMALRALADGKASRFRMLGRGYLTNDKDGSLVMPMSSAEYAIHGGAVTTTSQFPTHGYPFPTPAMAATDDGATLLWLEDDPDRTEDQNRTRLRAAFRTTGGDWGSPASVWDDGTADFTPSVALASDGFAVAAWMNLNTTLPSDANLMDGLAAAEIAVRTGSLAAGFDGIASNLTANTWLDHSPVAMASRADLAIVTWIENAAGDHLGASTNRNTIRSAVWDGTAWSLMAVADEVGMIRRYDAVMAGTNAFLVAAVDGDDDLETVSDVELYGTRFDGTGWSGFERLTDNAVADLNPRLGTTGNAPLLVWLRGGALVSAVGWPFEGSGSQHVAAPEYDSALADARLLSAPDGRAALIWQDGGAGEGWTTDPAVLFYDAALDVWGHPQRLFEAEGIERDFAGAFGPGETLTLAYADVVPPTPEPGELPGFDDAVVTLRAADLTMGCDVALVADSVVFSEPPRPGTTVDVSVIVANLGETALVDVDVAFYDGDPSDGGFLIAEPLALPGILAAGESVTVTQRWDIGIAQVQRQLWVIADPYGAQPDRSRSNNTLTQVLFAAKPRVAAMDVVRQSLSGRAVSARIHNAGDLAWLHNAQVVFRLGDTNGVELSRVAMPESLPPGVSFDAAIAHDFDGITYPTAFVHVYAVIESNDEPGCMLGWNHARVATGLDSDGDGLIDADEIFYGTDPDLADSDGDGLNDFDEIFVYGTGPNNPDTSGSGMRDGDEVIAGTDPRNAADTFVIIDVQTIAGQARIVWPGKAGRTYRVQRSANLTDWHPAPSGSGEHLAQRVVNNSGPQVYIDPEGMGYEWSYRVSVEVSPP